MAERGAPRLFTVAEANALLPRLRDILAELRAARERLLHIQEQLAERIHGGARSNGHIEPGGETAQLTAASEAAQRDMTRAVRAIAELGCELKDPDRGMVDFRTMRDGRVVYLCWLMDEPEVQFWHELDAGYRGRQRL
ncbi:MAG TPA: DUF2203 domain-containing protein [Chloroflexota bacterium]|nr:DUF2203 domain-containing protein [Chloroflexota bacterium]